MVTMSKQESPYLCGFAFSLDISFAVVICFRCLSIFFPIILHNNIVYSMKFYLKSVCNVFAIHSEGILFIWMFWLSQIEREKSHWCCGCWLKVFSTVMTHQAHGRGSSHNAVRMNKEAKKCFDSEYVEGNERCDIDKVMNSVQAHIVLSVYTFLMQIFRHNLVNFVSLLSLKNLHAFFKICFHKLK